MKDHNTYNSNVTIGQTVEINPRDDRTRKLRVSGIVSEIFTKNKNHPHGLLVKLESGQIGRVKSASGLEQSTPEAEISQPEQTTQKLIESGENHMIEFKTDALWSANYTSEDIKNHRPQTKELHLYGKVTSKIIIAKTLSAFLNSDGGNLLIGYKEGKNGQADEVVGIEPELQKLKDPSLDGYRRMLIELVKEYFPAAIFNQFNNYFRITFDQMDEKTICRIDVRKSDKRVFLKIQRKDYFFIRVDASTRELIGEEIIDFCDSRFT